MSLTLSRLVLLLLACGSADAIIVVPTGLNPGDQYRLVFVTSTTTTATSTDITYYNNFVSGVAELVPELAALSTTWKAIGSTAALNALTNTSTDPSILGGAPIYRLDGIKIADNNADLWDGSIDSPMVITQLGTMTTATFAWTGTTGNGGGATPYELGGGLGTNVGYTNQYSTFRWINAQAAAATVQTYPLYAISGTLTAVPIPPAVWLFGSALGLMGVMRRKAH